MLALAAHRTAPAIPGCIEPHAGLLVAPLGEQLLYKVMSVENLLRSIDGSYLHFNRVDRYSDFPKADRDDGRQLPSDHETNARARFERDPSFSLADFYDRSRGRTYACCFATENSEHVWREYGNGDPRGKVCAVFNFTKLRKRLNQTLAADQGRLLHRGRLYPQIFSVNYGVVRYVDFSTHRAISGRSPNPILYTYLKDKQYEDEKELRVSLSAFGIGHYVLGDQPLVFPSSVGVHLNWIDAVNDGTAICLLVDQAADHETIREELRARRILPKQKAGAL